MAPKSKWRRQARSPQQTPRANGTSITTQAPRKEELLARALKRGERANARRVYAEQHKATVRTVTCISGLHHINESPSDTCTFQGNAHFRRGEYRKAIAEWEVAMKINGPTATLLSNMAQAWLNLEA